MDTRTGKISKAHKWNLPLYKSYRPRALPHQINEYIIFRGKNWLQIFHLVCCESLCTDKNPISKNTVSLETNKKNCLFLIRERGEFELLLEDEMLKIQKKVESEVKQPFFKYYFHYWFQKIGIIWKFPWFPVLPLLFYEGSSSQPGQISHFLVILSL